MTAVAGPFGLDGVRNSDAPWSPPEPRPVRIGPPPDTDSRTATKPGSEHGGYEERLGRSRVRAGEIGHETFRTDP